MIYNRSARSYSPCVPCTIHALVSSLCPVYDARVRFNLKEDGCPSSPVKVSPSFYLINDNLKFIFILSIFISFPQIFPAQARIIHRFYNEIIPYSAYKHFLFSFLSGRGLFSPLSLCHSSNGARAFQPSRCCSPRPLWGRSSACG